MLTVALLVAPDVGSARQVTLQQVLDQSEQQATSVRLARAATERAEIAVEDARSLLPGNPTVAVLVGARNTGQGTAVEWQASVQQPFGLVGVRRARKHLAARERDRTDAWVDAAVYDVELVVRLAYWDAVIAAERLDLAEALEASAARVAEVAEKRNRLGEGTGVEQTLAAAGQASAHQASLVARRDYKVACRMLARRAGYPIGESVCPSTGLPDPPSAPRSDAPEVPDLEDNPRLRALDAEVASASARETLARKLGMPQPSIGVQVQREAEIPGPDHTIGFATLSVPLPLWRRNRAARASARADRVIAEEQRRLGERGLAYDAILLSTTMSMAAERLVQFEEGVRPKLDASLTAAERAFQLGEADASEVLVAQQRYLEAQRRALDAWADYLQSRAALRVIAGDDTTGAR